MKSPAPLLKWFKEALNNLLSVIKGLLLTVVALVLLCFAVPSAVIFYLVTIWKKKQQAREIMARNGRFFYLVALAVDHLGNVISPGLFNWLFLRSLTTSFLFGVPGQSISQVLGWNQALNNLSRTGLLLVRVLNVFEAEHCEKAVTKTIEDARQYLQACREAQNKIELTERTSPRYEIAHT